MRNVNVYDLKLATREFVEKYLDNTLGKTFPPGHLTVRFSGTKAYCAYDGPRALINFPSLPDMTFVSRGEADRIVGFALHECGHFDCTDLREFEQAARAYGPFMQQLVNGLEDPRMEHVQMTERRAANARPIFEDLLAWLLLDIDKAQPFDPNDPRNMPFTLAVLGRQHLDGYQHPVLDILRSRIKPKWQDWYLQALEGLAACHSTADVIALALRLWQELKEKMPQSEPEQQDDQQQRSDQSSKDEQDGESEDQQDGGEGDKPADGSDPADKSEAGTPKGDVPTSAEELDRAAERGEVKQPEPDQLMEELAERINQRASKEPAYKDETGTGVLGSHAPCTGVQVRDLSSLCGDEGRWQLAVSQIPPGQAALRRYLWLILRSPEVSGWDNRKSAGRFDRRSFGRLLSGSERVFQQRWLTPGIETAISVLLDLSSSMTSRLMRNQPSKIEVTQTMTIMLAQIFEQARVQYEVIGFKQGGEGEELPKGKPFRGGMDDCSIFSEGTVSCQIVQFKRFNQSLKNARYSLSSITQQPGGGTPDYEGIRAAIDRLVPVQANRKVLFVLTDGEGAGAEKIRDACRFAEFRGIDVIGVGLMHSVKDQYKLSIDVHRPEDLTGNAMRLLVKQIDKYVAGRRVA